MRVQKYDNLHKRLLYFFQPLFFLASSAGRGILCNFLLFHFFFCLAFRFSKRSSIWRRTSNCSRRPFRINRHPCRWPRPVWTPGLAVQMLSFAAIPYSTGSYKLLFFEHDMHKCTTCTKFLECKRFSLCCLNMNQQIFRLFTLLTKYEHVSHIE